MRSPIVISNRSGFVTKGHCRLEAVKKLGWDKAPVNYQDYESEAQEYADMTADNEIARWAELDKEKLVEDIKDYTDDFDLDLLGLDSLEFLESKIDGTDFQDNTKLDPETKTCPHCGEML